MGQVATAGSVWERTDERTRRVVIWILWFVTWIGLLAGYVDRRAWAAVVVFSAVHATVFFVLNGFRLAPFPVQVRVAYVLWVAVGTYVPHMTVLMVITTVGLVGNLFFKYCPLARMLHLLPWNRSEAFSLDLVVRVFLTPPVDGRFKRPLPRQPPRA